MDIVHEYKIKDGITAEDIKAELKEKKLPISNGGTYVSEDAVFITFFTIADDIGADIAFPEDLSKWDSFDHITVFDEAFGQPYYPFYEADMNENRRFAFALGVIGRYNKRMDSFNFLERLTSEELEAMKERHKE